MRAQSFDKRATSISRGWKDRDRDKQIKEHGEGKREHTERRGIPEQKGEVRTTKVKRREASHAAYAQTFLSFPSTPRRPLLHLQLTCEFTNNRPSPSHPAALTRMFGRKRPRVLNVGRDSTSRRTAIAEWGLLPAMRFSTRRAILYLYPFMPF